MADKVLAGVIRQDALVALSAEKLDVVVDVFEDMRGRVGTAKKVNYLRTERLKNRC
jgi:hypothetical protein